jgi:predicted nucleic acid-binding protein
MAYWDTSALLKLYVAEADSPYFLELIAGTAESVISSAIATAEVLCVLYRKEHARALKHGAAKRVYRRFVTDMNAGRVLLIPFGRDVECEAEKIVRSVFAQPQPILVRSLDLIHVSTALSAGATRFVATDARLRSAAVLAGLELLP